MRRGTGLFLSPHYGASKLRWALDHVPAVAQAALDGSLAWGPMESFLVHRLLRERPHLAEPQCAARTQLWNLATGDWDARLALLFGLPQGFLPQVTRTVGDWGRLECAGVALPMRAVNGDQSAAVFAFGWPETGSAAGACCSYCPTAGRRTTTMAATGGICTKTRAWR